MNCSTLSLTSALDGRECLTPRPGRFTPGKRPGTHFTVDWVGPRAGMDGCGKSCPQSGHIKIITLKSCDNKSSDVARTLEKKKKKLRGRKTLNDTRDGNVRRLYRTLLQIDYSDLQSGLRFTASTRVQSPSICGPRNLLASLTACSAALWLCFLYHDPSASLISYVRNYSLLFQVSMSQN